MPQTCQVCFSDQRWWLTASYAEEEKVGCWGDPGALRGGRSGGSAQKDGKDRNGQRGHNV